MREITVVVRPPRALWVPYEFGYPLGRAKDAALQHGIIAAALKLLELPGPPPLLQEFEEIESPVGNRDKRGEE